MSNAEFIRRATSKHGGRYSYALTNFTSTKKKVHVSCPTHGRFEQSASAHLYRGQGCPGCSEESNRGSAAEFIAHATALFGERFSYDKVTYVDSKTHVTITCSLHGDFEQSPNCHLRSVEACPPCGRASTGMVSRSTTERFIESAREVHGDRYDYSASEYTHVRGAVRILCHEHGEFSKLPVDHYAGSGCPACRETRGESAVRQVLEAEGIEFSSQWGHPTLRHIRPLRFDFAIPARMIAIEFDGGQHFAPVNFRGGMTDEQMSKTFEAVVLRDAIKTRWAKDNGWHLVRLSNTVGVRHALVCAGVLSADPKFV
jgi:very-short-patch-repair endonuclease